MSSTSTSTSSSVAVSFDSLGFRKGADKKKSKSKSPPKPKPKPPAAAAASRSSSSRSSSSRSSSSRSSSSRSSSSSSDFAVSFDSFGNRKVRKAERAVRAAPPPTSSSSSSASSGSVHSLSPLSVHSSSSNPEVDLNSFVSEHLDLFERILYKNMDAVMRGKTLRPRRQSVLEAEEHAGIRVKVLEDGQWTFLGTNAGFFLDLYNKYMVLRGEEAVLTHIGAKQMPQILGLTMEQFQAEIMKLLPSGMRVFVERPVRPKGGISKVTRESMLYLPSRPYEAHIIGMKNYRLPKDLMKFLSFMDIPYRPEYNPRRRRRVKGQVRDRYVFAFNQGAYSSGFVDAIVSGADVVLPSRNWKAICPFVIYPYAFKDVPDSDPIHFIKWVYENAGTMDYFCGTATLAKKHDWSHSVCYYAYLTPSKSKKPNHHTLRIFLLDPHATTNTEPEGTRIFIKGLVESNHLAKQILGKEGLANQLVIDDVKVMNTSNACGFKRQDVRMLAAQYNFESSCTLSSIALLLSIARNLRKYTLQIFTNRRAFCRKVYADIKPQDVVIAAQLSRI